MRHSAWPWSVTGARATRIGAAVLLLGAGAAAFASLPSPGPDAAAPATTVGIERDGFRYEFDILLDTESLRASADAADQRRNVLREHPADARRLRAELEQRLGVKSLDDLRDAHRKEFDRARTDALHRLGYL